MIRTVTPEDAAVLSHGCTPAFDYPDKAVIMMDADLREVCRVHVWRQDWIAPDGRSVSHVEIRVPAMGVVFIDDSAEHVQFSHKGLFVNRPVVGLHAWDDARREIHAWMEAQLGYSCPFEASALTHGGWFEADEFVLRERNVPNLSFQHDDDIGPTAARAWQKLGSEPAGSKNVDEFRLADLADEAFDVAVDVPLEHAEPDESWTDASAFDDIGFGEDNDEQAVTHGLFIGADVTRPEAVGYAKRVCRRVTLGPQLRFTRGAGSVAQFDLFKAGCQGDVECGPEGLVDGVSPAFGSFADESHRGRAPPRAARDEFRLFSHL